jgi:hypothetical protein
MLADCFMVAILAAGAAKCDLRARALSTGRSLLQRGIGTNSKRRTVHTLALCGHTRFAATLKDSNPHHTLTQGMLSPDTTQIAERRLRYQLLYAVSLMIVHRGIVQVHLMSLGCTD